METNKPTSDQERQAATGFDINKAVDAAAETQKRALERAPAEHAAILQIVWVMALLVTILGGVLLYNRNDLLGFGSIFLGVVLGGVGMYLLRPARPPLQPLPSAKSAHGVGQVQGGAPKQGVVEWSRTIVKLPITVPRLNDLNARLGRLLAVAQAKYSSLLQGRRNPPNQIDPKLVRINAFLPDTRDAHFGEVCALFIPRGLHHGMKNDAERGIRFRPNEGLTGRVFTYEKAFGALRASAKADWQHVHFEESAASGDEQFQLTLEQVNLIDKDLRWIVGFPLRITFHGAARTIGVLNVDGLGEALTEEEMRLMYNTLREAVDDFSKELSELEKCRTTILVEDIK